MSSRPDHPYLIPTCISYNAFMLKTDRTSTYPIQPIILNRWSPRAMTGEPIDDETLLSFFEAARWAPSSSNNQLTRFIYSTPVSETWKEFFDLLTEGNQKWCKNAAALVIAISRTHAYYKNRKQRTHIFEAGLAVENLMIEATSRGFVAHTMGGFDPEKAHGYLKLSDLWNVEVMIAIGFFDPEKSKQKEEKASDRKPINEIVFKDRLPENFE